MIIGNGLIAKSFKKEKNYFKNVIIFASGVSNSKNINFKEFKREKKLVIKLLKKKKNKIFIYFSSLDIFRKIKTPYINHKINLEKLLIKEKNVLIIRLPQLIGNSKNKYTLFNFLKQNLKKNKKIIIYKNFYRNFVDVEDVVKSIKKLKLKIKKFNKLNLFNKKSIKISEIVNFFVNHKIIKNKIFKFNYSQDLHYYKMSKFYKDKYIEINKKNYYSKVFKKYIV